jgi:hypothetical protein
MAEDATVERDAYYILFTQCMRRFGFTVPPKPPPREPLVVGNERIYGVVDAERARTTGYHLPRAKTSPTVTAPTSQSPAYRVVAEGGGPDSYAGQRVPEGGCSGESYRKLADGAPDVEDERLGDNLAGTASQRAEADSRVQTVFAEWSACMKRSGHDYASPAKAVNDPSFVTDEPTPKEIAVAIADVRCKAEVDLVNVRTSVDVAYQKIELERHAEALEKIRLLLETRQRNAARVLVGG